MASNDNTVPVASSVPMTASVSIPLVPNLPNLNPSLPIVPPGGFIASLPIPGVPPLLPPRLPIVAPVSGALPAAIPGLPLPGSLPFMPPRLPISFSFPGRPLVPGVVNPSATNAVLDPNNDVTCWSEHSSEEGRKYWYNSVTFVSTYEKPFCLKTPEERSIPPCPWKEYFAEGKVYYSNGKESTWVMPEEFRTWKEKVDALEKKIQEEKLQLKNAEKGNGSNNPSNNSGATANHPTLSKANSVQNLLKSRSEDFTQQRQEIKPTTYASLAEATEAFKELLAQKNISTIAKMKEVQDLCQHDHRWEALKTMGERKQALAEYQTKKLKLEKEAQKQKARKHKDAFLLMLAENTDIDARTKWKDAIEILKDDQRYKNVEEMREREDLFRDFILELEKKEREDINKQKEKALAYVKDFLQSLTNEQKTATFTSTVTSKPSQQPPVITHKSNWNDYRQYFTDLINSRNELRVALNENDCKKIFYDYLHQLGDKIKLEEKKKRDEYLQEFERSKHDLRTALEGLATVGTLNAFTRWKEFQTLPTVLELPSYKNLYRLMTVANPLVNNNSSLVGNNGGNSSNGSTSFTRQEEDFHELLREMFDRIISRAQEQYKEDRRIIKKFAWDNHIDILPEMKYSEFKEALLRKSHLVEKKNEDSSGKLKEEFEISTGPTIVNAFEPTKMVEDHPEEGEEIEEPQEKTSLGKPLNDPSSRDRRSSSQGGGDAVLNEIQSILLSRPFNLKDIFEDLYDKVMIEYEEERRKQKKLEEKYISLLKDYFYLSDHVGLKWDDAKSKLQGRSAYEALNRSDRKRLYHQYMEELAEKMKQKSMAMKAYEVLEPGEFTPPPYIPPVTNKDSKKRDRSNSSTEFEKLVRMKK